MTLAIAVVALILAIYGAVVNQHLYKLMASIEDEQHKDKKTFNAHMDLYMESLKKEKEKKTFNTHMDKYMLSLKQKEGVK